MVNVDIDDLDNEDSMVIELPEMGIKDPRQDDDNANDDNDDRYSSLVDGCPPAGGRSVGRCLTGWLAHASGHHQQMFAVVVVIGCEVSKSRPQLVG